MGVFSRLKQGLSVLWSVFVFGCLFILAIGLLVAGFFLAPFIAIIAIAIAVAIFLMVLAKEAKDEQAKNDKSPD